MACNIVTPLLYVIDFKDRDLTRLPLIERRVMLKSLVMIDDKRIRISEYVEAGATELLAAVREQHLEVSSESEKTGRTNLENEVARRLSIA